MSDQRMAVSLKEIGALLYDAYTDTDPLSVEGPDLRSLMQALDALSGERVNSLDDDALEMIQQAWYERYQEAPTEGEPDIGVGD